MFCTDGKKCYIASKCMFNTFKHWSDRTSQTFITFSISLTPTRTRTRFRPTSLLPYIYVNGKNMQYDIIQYSSRTCCTQARPPPSAHPPTGFYDTYITVKLNIPPPSNVTCWMILWMLIKPTVCNRLSPPDLVILRFCYAFL